MKLFSPFPTSHNDHLEGHVQPTISMSNWFTTANWNCKSTDHGVDFSSISKPIFWAPELVWFTSAYSTVHNTPKLLNNSISSADEAAPGYLNRCKAEARGILSCLQAAQQIARLKIRSRISWQFKLRKAERAAPKNWFSAAFKLVRSQKLLLWCLWIQTLHRNSDVKLA